MRLIGSTYSHIKTVDSPETVSMKVHVLIYKFKERQTCHHVFAAASDDLGSDLFLSADLFKPIARAVLDACPEYKYAT
jgi:hypothetical protein